ncbi:hypothetical protein ABZW30_23455 [Kitasatospora sp. NPDC004669]|uniref:hypothetical protein n=1 Tax=Kitasatospora sp. NPDC004669 TaxID=3154555 RepID=UPI0033BE5BAB
MNSTPDGLDIAPVGLPGREKRFSEPPLDQVADVVEDVLPWVRERRLCTHEGWACQWAG